MSMPNETKQNAGTLRFLLSDAEAENKRLAGNESAYRIQVKNWESAFVKIRTENETLRQQNAELVRALKLAYRHMHMADHLQSEYAHALQTVSDTINKVQS